MTRPVIDVIEWDGTRFCAFAEPYLLFCQPNFDRQTQQLTVSLVMVCSTLGATIPISQFSSEDIDWVEAFVLLTWQAWEGPGMLDQWKQLRPKKIFKQTATRIFQHPEYNESENNESVKNILARAYRQIEQRQGWMSHE